MWGLVIWLPGVSTRKNKPNKVNIHWNIGEKLRYSCLSSKKRNFLTYSFELVFLIYPFSSKNHRRFTPTSWMENIEKATEKCETDGSKHFFSVINVTSCRAKMVLNGLVFVGIEEESIFIFLFENMDLWKFLATAVKLSSHQQNAELRIEVSVLNEAMPLETQEFSI